MPNAQTSTVIPESLRAMYDLVSPFGLVSRVEPLRQTEGEPRFSICSGFLGDPGAALGVQDDWTHDPSAGNFDGAGGDLDREVAAHLAVAESLERYSSCAWDPDELIWATADELGDEAIPPAVWPTCSPTELADPRSGLLPSDPRIPIRWVRGWSLTRHQNVFVPAIQVYLRFQPESRAELYTHGISTGCAAHGSVEDAVVNGLLEVVERDAIAMTWLQRLRLPRLHVDPDQLSPTNREFVERARSTTIRTMLFDATTDLGIPVVYGLQLADYDPTLSQMVVATCDLDPGRGIAKLHREAASLRIALRSLAGSTAAGGPRVSSPEDTISVVGGALLAGSRDKRELFDFLLDGERPVHHVDDLARPPAGAAPLPWLVDKLAAAGCEPVVVDLRTDEARQVGASVVKVLVPQLMPLSFAHRARYLAHPRLYRAPAAMGHRVYPEAQLNPHPQPFA